MRLERSYSLVFGNPITLDDDYFIYPLERGSAEVINLEDYVSSLGGTSGASTLIEGHEIQFNVIKKEKTNNTAQITIENLSEGTMNYLMTNRTSNLVIQLSVGYDGTNKLLIRGVLSDCVITRTSNTSKTTLTVDDGKLNSKKAYSSRTYPTGTKFKTIVDDLRVDLALPKGTIVDFSDTETTDDNISVMGNSFDALNRFCEDKGYTPTITNGGLYIMPVVSRTSTTVSSITRDSGLIGYVKPLTILNKSNNVTNTDTSGSARIRFTCQMDATLNPQTSVYVQDETTGVDGVYKIENSTFSCSSFERGTWIVTVDAVETTDVVSI